MTFTQILPVALAGALIGCPTQYLQSLSWVGSAPSASSSNIVDSGDLDVSGTWRAIAGSDTAPSFDAFAASSAEGTMSLHYEATNTSTTASGRWMLTVRGVLILTVEENFPLSSAALQWRVGDDVTWRAWYRPSTGQAGVRITVNGVTAPDTTAATTGSALAAPTVVSAYYAPSTVADVTQTQTFIARFSWQAPRDTTPEFLILGDSTLASFWYQAARGPNVGSWQNLISVGHDVYTAAQRSQRHGIGLVAVPGDTVEGQKAKFLASPWSSQGNVSAVIIEVGINNFEFLLDSLATVTTKVQDLIDTVRAALPSAKILVSKVVPYGLFDATSVAGFIVPFNNNTMGTGTQNLTGVDYRIGDHYATLDNGSGGYKSIYDFDDIHENNDGRAVVAAAYRAALQALGLLP